MSETVRISRFLAMAGIASRRASDAYIVNGRVKVNGKVMDTLGSKVDPEHDLVEFDGKEIHLAQKTIIGILNKPAGYLTSCDDPFSRSTVMEILPEDVRTARVFPVGRLDKDTEGLLLITNDGNLAYRLTHPSFGIEKVYVACVKGVVSPAAVEELQRGVLLEDGPTSPSEVKVVRIGSKETLLEITIHEGRKRQVRRMCSKVGHRVKRLIRTRVGPLELGNLELGAWRLLSSEERTKIMAVCGLNTAVE